MKKFLLIISMLFSLTACATNMEVRLTKKYENIDPESQTYVEEFKVLSKGKVKDSHLKGFTMGLRKYKNGSSTAGTCHYIVNEVDISKDWWERSYTAAERLELIFHELGHCILKRGHTSKPNHKKFGAWIERLGFKFGMFTEKGYLYDGCPASFMHPYTINDSCINKHFHYYINELFNNYKENNHVMQRKNHNHKVENKKFCKKPKIINKTSTWNERDRQTLNRAKIKCIEEYNSCLKIFIKKEELAYNAICE